MLHSAAAWQWACSLPVLVFHQDLGCQEGAHQTTVCCVCTSRSPYLRPFRSHRPWCTWCTWGTIGSCRQHQHQQQQQSTVHSAVHAHVDNLKQKEKALPVQQALTRPVLVPRLALRRISPGAPWGPGAPCGPCTTGLSASCDTCCCSCRRLPGCGDSLLGMYWKGRICLGPAGLQGLAGFHGLAAGAGCCCAAAGHCWGAADHCKS